MRVAIAWTWMVAISVMSAAAQATVIDFQATCGGSVVADPCPVGTTYSAVGVTFAPNTQDVCMGLSNGDPGNWGLEGTNSAKFLCFNGGNPGYSMDVTLATPANSVSLDVSRSNGSQAGDTFTVNALNGATLLSTQTVTLGPINTWTTITLTAAGINHLTWTGNGADFHPYGIENLVLTDGAIVAARTAVPTVSPWALLAIVALLALAAFATLRRNRRRTDAG